jgi:DNA polymerase-3 subunit chi
MPHDSFLPHGLEGGTYDREQPILLTTKDEIPNQAQALITIEGADVQPSDLGQIKRISVLFDGNDPDAVTKARAQWKTLVAQGCSAKYWSQESGRWEMKASS